MSFDTSDFRPIVMTSPAYIRGALPLALGDCANARHSVGTRVIGEMLVRGLLEPLSLPAMFVWANGAGGWVSRRLRPSPAAARD